jgi:hypothetical protein
MKTDLLAGSCLFGSLIFIVSSSIAYRNPIGKNFSKYAAVMTFVRLTFGQILAERAVPSLLEPLALALEDRRITTDGRNDYSTDCDNNRDHGASADTGELPTADDRAALGALVANRIDLDDSHSRHGRQS